MKYAAIGLVLASGLMATPALAADPAAAQTSGNPHSCEAFYPRSALVTREAGTMVVAFTISEQGEVQSPRVTKATGYDDLDQAGLGCVKTWRYAPATHAGKPVAAEWKAELVWAAPAVTASARSMEPLEFSRPPRNCFTYYHVTPHQFAHVDGTTTVSYRVARGEVTDVAVTHSSGNPDLDKDAVSCVSSWEYKSVTASGASSDRMASISVPWKDVESPPDHPRDGY